MRRILFLAVAVSLLCASAAAQPTITGVVNAASFLVAGLPNSGIALGSMFVIFGTGLGPSALTQVSSYPLPTSGGLAGTTVHINTVSAAGQMDAIMIYTSANQVAAIVPSALNFTGTVVLTVTYNGQTSNTFFVSLTAGSFGSFTLPQSGTGQAVAQNYNSDADEPFNNVANPAKPGQLMILWGTGLGPVSGPETQRPLPGQLNLNLQVYVGGKQAQLSYYGRSGCCSGIDQVVFAVPQGVAGCGVPVSVVINGIPSNTASIAVSGDGSACSDAVSTSSSDIQTAASSGAARVATVTLSHTDGGNPADSGSASFLTTPFANFSAGGGGFPSPGSCLVLSGSSNASSAASASKNLDAGTALQVSGPGGTGQLTRAANGSYSGALPAIQAGNYTVSGSGGADVGAFSATLNVPPPMTWTNRTALSSILPGSPITVNWSGGDPNAYVLIEGVPLSSSNGLFSYFLCVEHAGAGTFQVPGYVTAAMPPETAAVLVTQNGTPARFAASGIDVGLLSYASGSFAGPLTVGSSGGGGKK